MTDANDIQTVGQSKGHAMLTNTTILVNRKIELLK
jgi:hypothetical protein